MYSIIYVVGCNCFDILPPRTVFAKYTPDEIKETERENVPYYFEYFVWLESLEVYPTLHPGSAKSKNNSFQQKFNVSTYNIGNIAVITLPAICGL